MLLHDGEHLVHAKVLEQFDRQGLFFCKLPRKGGAQTLKTWQLLRHMVTCILHVQSFSHHHAVPGRKHGNRHRILAAVAST